MPLTPDSELDLLFSASLISPEIKRVLHQDLHMRPLARTDYSRGHLDILGVLTQVSDPGEEAWCAQFDALRAPSDIYYCIVVVERATDKIIGVGSVIIERKFLRGLSRVGHLEDVAVDPKLQGKKVGLHILNALTYISEASGSYKTILNCNESKIPFYKKCGFDLKEVEMAKYAKVETPRSPRL